MRLHDWFATQDGLTNARFAAQMTEWLVAHGHGAAAPVSQQALQEYRVNNRVPRQKPRMLAIMALTDGQVDANAFFFAP